MPTLNLLSDKLTLGAHTPFPKGKGAGGIGRRTYSARFVRAGRIRQADNLPADIEILPDALSRAVEKGLFNHKAVFIDHAGFFETPSLRDLVGDTHDSIFTGDAVEGKNTF